MWDPPSAATFSSAVYMGTGEGDVGGSITNAVNAGTFSKTFAGGSRNGTVNGDITNVITGGAFKGDFGGVNEHGTVAGDVVNNISGGATFAGFMAGTYTAEAADDPATADVDESVAGTNILGQITNTVQGTDSLPKFNNRSSYGIAYFSGSRSGRVDGGIVNRIEGGWFASRFYGGGYAGSLDTSSPSTGLN